MLFRYTFVFLHFILGTRGSTLVWVPSVAADGSFPIPSASCCCWHTVCCFSVTCSCCLITSASPCGPRIWYIHMPPGSETIGCHTSKQAVGRRWHAVVWQKWDMKHFERKAFPPVSKDICHVVIKVSFLTHCICYIESCDMTVSVLLYSLVQQKLFLLLFVSTTSTC